MIILGGFTRLTESGLSITEWNVVSGILPPLNHSDWEILFAKYQETPEFKIINFAMGVEEFKQIFWLEYLHRILGRILGLVTLLGFGYFVMDKNLSLTQKLRSALITVLIPLQGLIGWFMVKSGLSVRTDVSHFMLAFHLFAAFVLLFILARFYYCERYNALVGSSVKPEVGFLRLIIAVTFIQVIFGAFVAGLNAGLIYNEFPLMGEGYIPNEVFYHDLLSMDLITNPAIVQFIHRNIALVLLALVLYLGYKFYNKFNRYLKKQYKLVIYLLLLQTFIGISTLLTSVNIYIAVLHQFVAAILIFRLSWFYISLLKR